MKRDKWWSYMKAIIKAYDAAPESYPIEGVELREYEAVQRALAKVADMPDGDARMKVINPVLRYRTHTISGAALEAHVSERTARRWHTEFIRSVAQEYGLLPENAGES